MSLTDADRRDCAIHRAHRGVSVRGQARATRRIGGAVHRGERARMLGQHERVPRAVLVAEQRPGAGAERDDRLADRPAHASDGDGGRDREIGQPEPFPDAGHLCAALERLLELAGAVGRVGRREQQLGPRHDRIRHRVEQHRRLVIPAGGIHERELIGGRTPRVPARLRGGTPVRLVDRRAYPVSSQPAGPTGA